MRAGSVRLSAWSKPAACNVAARMPTCILTCQLLHARFHLHKRSAWWHAQLLPILNLYMARNKNLGDAIDYAQREATCLGELVAAALALLERTGGPDAFINIKYMVPTYESTLR